MNQVGGSYISSSREVKCMLMRKDHLGYLLEYVDNDILNVENN
jgi:hypothetical protein